jgi:hypothetical protein
VPTTPEGFKAAREYFVEQSEKSGFQDFALEAYKTIARYSASLVARLTPAKAKGRASA